MGFHADTASFSPEVPRMREPICLDMTARFRMQDCWAKTDEDGRPCLSVRDHCLNVGAVAEELQTWLPRSTTGLVPPGGIALIAAHDIGKISPGFLLKSPVWRTRWQAELGLDAEGHETRHAWTSQKFLALHSSNPPRWIMAIGGHHGLYLCADARPVEMPFAPSSIGSGVFEELRCELLANLETAFGLLPAGQDVTRGAGLHWFTGSMIFCDWIGSNTTWFAPGPELGDLERARANARTALAELGVFRHRVKADLRFSNLFGFETLRPLQKTLIQAMDAPGLYIVEAPMGDGKTEAALAGAYRRWSEGGERGLFFALPTQLTSNRIRDRVEAFFERVVAEESALALVHGNAWLLENRIRPLQPQPSAGETQEPDNAREANAWFSDSRRAMLAPFGVGTIDQALMAVVPVKHSALRMFGLGGKVVVIDEVHSYDPFTSVLVDRLVQWLLELGGTVIVLSATLTAARRASLVEAAGAKENSAPDDYPLVTKVASGSGQAVHISVSGSPPPERRVEIQLVSANDECWMREVASAAEGGASVLVIRNTVELARDTYRALRGLCRDVGVGFALIHSRFTQADRESNETKWTRVLGRDGDTRPRNGAILVGTQVLEQSLDIDADLLVTDLAPTDLILQRIGRLHRHKLSRPVGCETPRCLVLRPEVDWHAACAEILESLKPHRFIYPPFALYMAARVWGELDSLRLPKEIRRLLEDSAAIPGDLPAAVRGFQEELERAAGEMRSAAWMSGVFKTPSVGDTEGAQTRWRMQPSAWLVVLAERPARSGHRVDLLFPDGARRSFDESVFDFPLARLLRLHAIRVPAYLVRGLHAQQPAWLSTHLQDAVLSVRDETNRLVPWPECNGAFDFSYSAESGLGFSRNKTKDTSYKPEEDETWY